MCIPAPGLPSENDIHERFPAEFHQYFDILCDFAMVSNHELWGGGVDVSVCLCVHVHRVRGPRGKNVYFHAYRDAILRNSKGVRCVWISSKPNVVSRLNLVSRHTCGCKYMDANTSRMHAWCIFAHVHDTCLACTVERVTEHATMDDLRMRVFMCASKCHLGWRALFRSVTKIAMPACLVLLYVCRYTTWCHLGRRALFRSVIKTTVHACVHMNLYAYGKAVHTYMFILLQTPQANIHICRPLRTTQIMNKHICWSEHILVYVCMSLPSWTTQIIFVNLTLNICVELTFRQVCLVGGLAWIAYYLTIMDVCLCVYSSRLIIWLLWTYVYVYTALGLLSDYYGRMSMCIQLSAYYLTIMDVCLCVYSSRHAT